MAGHSALHIPAGVGSDGGLGGPAPVPGHQQEAQSSSLLVPHGGSLTQTNGGAEYQ